MQSLQADQSLYNRKGVCCIVYVIGRLLVLIAKLKIIFEIGISDHDEKP